MKIRPTLYVGLGTTGTDILNHLRVLNHQEYGRAGLPIFRYVSIETDNSSDGTTPQIDMRSNLESYEVNQVITTTIPNTQPIYERLQPNSPRYDKHLAEWLDEKVLGAPATTHSGGAGNLRMVGRLSLWENWNQRMRVQRHLRESYDTVCEDENIELAAREIKSHFGSGVSVDTEHRNVFIVGTLCGGTCSGMLLDIAYYFRHIDTAGDTQLYGIFTMYDEALTSDAPKIQLANCYASLVEQDYYQRSDIAYQVTLPNGPAIHTTQPPFDMSTFLSATNMKGRRFIKNGQFDQGQLDRMVAFELFMRSLGVDAHIDADLVNAPAFDSQFGEVREENQFVQYMFSSGLDSVWLPKTTVVKAAAIEYVEKIRAKWQERRGEGSASADVATQNLLFDRILDDIGSGLVKTNGTPLVKLLDNDILMIDGDDSLTDAANCLKALVDGGKHYQRFDENRDDCFNQIAGEFDGKSEEFLDRIGERIQTELKKPDYPDNLVSFQDIQTRVGQAEELASIETRGGFLGLSKKREFNLPVFRGKITEEQAQLRDQLKLYFVKKVLSDLYDEIPKRKTEIRETHRKQRDEHTLIQNNLEQCRKLVDSDLPAPVVRAAARLAQEHQDELDSSERVDELIQDLLKSGPNYFYGHLIRKFTNSPRFDIVVSDVIEDFDPDIGRRSSPYQAFAPNYLGIYRLSLELPGGDTRLFRFLLAKQQQANTPTLSSDAQAAFKEMHIPHLRAAYQMEAGFTIDDLAVASRLKEEYDAYQLAYRHRLENPETPGAYPIHIDRDPNKFNPDAIRNTIAASTRAEEVEEDWRAIRELLPRIRERYPDRFQYVSPNGSLNGNGNLNGNGTLGIGQLEARIASSQDGIKSTVRDEAGHEKLAQDEELCENFMSTTRREFKNLRDESPSLADFIDEVNAEIENYEEREESEKFYKAYLRLLDEA